MQLQWPPKNNAQLLSNSFQGYTDDTYRSGHSVALHQIGIGDRLIATSIGVVDNAVERLIDELPENNGWRCFVELGKTSMRR